jgi:hypothetical protein
MESWKQVYQRQYLPDFPVVCLDEATKRHRKVTVEQFAAKPGQPKRPFRKFSKAYYSLALRNGFIK